MSITISGAGINNNNDDKIKGASINYKENQADKSKVNAFSNTFLGGTPTGVTMSKGDNSKQKMDANTYKSLINEADDVKAQIMESATNAKAGLKALFMKLDGSQAVELDRDGFNLTEASKEECVNIIEKIRIELAMHCDNYVNFGADISREKIAAAVGSAGLANSIADRMTQVNLPMTEENISELTDAFDKVAGLTTPDEAVKNYMISHNMTPTIDNISQAEQVCKTDYMKSGNGMPKISDVEFNAMLPQLKNVLTSAGLEVNLKNLDSARGFIENGIPVTTKNLLMKNELDKLNFSDIAKGDVNDSITSMDVENQFNIYKKIIDNMAVSGKATDTVLTGTDSIIETVRDAIDTINKATFDDVNSILSQDKSFNIQELKLAYKYRAYAGNGSYINGENYNNATTDIHNANSINAIIADDDLEKLISKYDNANGSLSAQKAYSQLMETRILMTASAGVFLAKNGTNLLTTSISELVSQLKVYEQNTTFVNTENGRSLQADVLGMGDYTFADYELGLDTRVAALSISESPIDVLGAVLSDKLTQVDGATTSFVNVGYAISVSDIAAKGSSLKNQYERAGRTYDAVGTEVRRDLGDSMFKAVEASSESLLKDMNLEDTKENREAVRILAQNQMEINKDSVNQIKELYQMVKNVVNNMKPETVMNMIRDGINPMSTDIKAVNDYLIDMNNEATAANEEKFSKFLYKLDRTNGITSQERKQFIGIYQMMNIFTKDAGAAVGALVNQGADITMNNLMMAYNSRKNYSMDVNIDDSTGMAEIVGVANYYATLFENNKELITPNTLKNVSDADGGIDRQSVEHFVDELEDAYDEEVEMQLSKEYANSLSQATYASKDAMRLMDSVNIPDSIGNTMAVEQLMNSGMFPVMSNNDKRITIPNNEEIVEKIGQGDELEKMYENLDEEADEIINSVMSEGENISYEDFERLRIQGREIGIINNLARRHDYRIPFANENGVGMINLTLVSDSDENGKISIKLNKGVDNEVSIEAKIAGDSAGIFILSNKPEDLSEEIERITDALQEKMGFSSVKVSSGETNQVPYITYNDAATKEPNSRLFETAQTIINAFGVMK